MLMAHPAVLRPLVKEYEALAALPRGQGGEQARLRLEDVSYTLCVATGTRDIHTALRTARSQLSGAPPRDEAFPAQDDPDSEADEPDSAGEPRERCR